LTQEWPSFLGGHSCLYTKAWAAFSSSQSSDHSHISGFPIRKLTPG